MSLDPSSEATIAKQLLAVPKTREPSALDIVQSQRNMLGHKTPSDNGNGEVSISTARQRLSKSKAQELAALERVKSQREVLVMMKKNMAVAQSQLESCQRAVKEAVHLLKAAEKRRAMMIKCQLIDVTADHSPAQMQSHSSITCPQEQEIALPLIYQAQQPSLSFHCQASKSLNEPQLKSQLLNLRPEAKMILREVVMSAILHHSGKVDPGMLEYAMKKGGMSKRVVMNAVEVARTRLRKKQTSLARRAPSARRVPEKNKNLGVKGKMIGQGHRVLGTGTPDQARSFVFAHFSNAHGKNSNVPRTACRDTICPKKNLPKAA